MAKVDCSVTVNYARERARMCKYHTTRVKCHECPMGSSHNGTNYNCECLLFECPQKAIEIVQKWSDEHPVKTRLEDLLEKYPQTQLTNINKAPSFKPCTVGYCDNCDKCLKNHAAYYFCWHEPVDGGATGKAVE